MSLVAKNAVPDPAAPATQEHVVERLLERFDELPPQLQSAARYMIDHPHEVGVQTMRSLAAEIEIHPNSFTRLARTLGFEGYEQLRERFRDFVRSGSGSSTDRVQWLQQLARKGGSAAVLASMARSCLDNTEQMFQTRQLDSLDRAVNCMVNANRVYVLGLGLAYSLAYNFWYLMHIAFGHFYLIPAQGVLPGDELLHIGKGDCLVGMTFQPYRLETLEAIGGARTAGARTIAISDSVASSAFRVAEIGLCAPTHTPQFFQSNAAVSALIDTLSALMVVRGGEQAASAIERFNSSRWNANVYEDS